ncbi:DUF6036 family nucleotidyltransferase [Salinicoccus albus]|uniref:DUF6036 family nucleotidyltransferase n=1 Tax=Salinicoccus albus TaxID=418756 RepID=UPI0003721BB4|nr:DUF6036 family nucleotidyltransferase [Salinicoccus albus]
MFNLYEDAKERYEILNDILKEEGITGIELIVIGGEVGRTLLGESEYRSTLDIDVISEQDLPLEVIEKLNEAGLEYVGVLETPPPEDMEEAHTVRFSNLTIHYPSIEDFALSKLMTTRGKDDNDLRNYPILDSCDIDELKCRIKEYRTYTLNPNNPDYNFANLDEYLKVRGIKH